MSATKKCIVRADCLPPKAMTVAGNAESIAGDMARPVQITKRKKNEYNEQIGQALQQVIRPGFFSLGRRKRKCRAMTSAASRSGEVSEGGEQIPPEMAFKAIRRLHKVIRSIQTTQAAWKWR